MVINQVERQIPSVLADCYCLTAFSNCKTKKKLNQDLSLKLEPRQWPNLDKNVRCRYDVGLRTLWRENKFLSTRFWWFLISFRTDIAYFFILTGHLTVFRHIRLSDLDGSSLSTRIIIINPKMDFAKRRFLVNGFFYSQVNYCQLVWMCHNRTNSNKINRLHERCLPLIYNDKKSSFKDLLEKDGSVSIHHRNLRTLAVELFKVFKGLSPVIL